MSWGWTGKQTDNGDGTKRVVVKDEDGEVIYDMTADDDTVFGTPAYFELMDRRHGR